ncbi:Imm43 family immunity protein [Pedobacter caeni]|uniref:Immunity protein 43 n=1 Tax=Pedobacter caeni TaxID=288992 RepID=A0A1M5JRQ9_9SPHI|nr:Imm43 family immunity protein [Pedobacter caeni]SHG43261.1 Immunity protein 43 [Pedobacter caeni]
MEQQLYIAFNRHYLKRKGTPLTDDIVFFDSYDPNKRSKFFNESEWRTYHHSSSPFPPIEAKFKMPSKLYLLLKKKEKEILFDYLDYGFHIKIVSKEFYDFLCKHGLDKNSYEKSKLDLVDKDRSKLSNRTYYALRFGKFDNDHFDFHKESKIRTKVNGSTQYLYQDLELKQDIDKAVFVLVESAYERVFIIKGQKVLEEAKKQFIGIDFYDAHDFPFVFQHQYDDDILPIVNSYLK